MPRGRIETHVLIIEFSLPQLISDNDLSGTPNPEF